MTISRQREGFPHFLVIGAMRAGTTSFHHFLASHPDIRLPHIKETDFFIGRQNWQLGKEWYERQYALDNPGVFGEVCPNYAKADVFPGVPERAHAFNPNMRIFYIVRDPVERAISHYHHSLTYDRTLPPPADLMDSKQGLHILRTSQYMYQLRSWQEYFSDEQIAILDFQEMIENPQHTAQLVADHLGLSADGFDAGALKPANSSRDVASLPSFWMQQRTSRVGVWARRILPGAVAELLKRSAARFSKTPTPAEFDSNLRDQLAEHLSGDANEFRRFTGHSFSRWTI
ncbi:MAG: sulfotransferase family protein [Parvularcula sp.]